MAKRRDAVQQPTSVNGIEEPRTKYDVLDKTSLIQLLQQRDEELELSRVFDMGKASDNDSGAAADAGMYWNGKHRFLVEKVNPVRLSVVQEKSLNPGEYGDNLIISGDNLSVMSSLLIDYRGQVDVIYMDPPYNTGSDKFPYNDRFLLTKDQVKSARQQLKERTSVVTLDDPNRHTKWVNHMAPRLWVARKLLSQTGVIIISVDEHELPRLWLLMDEIFKENNRLTTLIWERSRKNDAKYFSEGHEYMLVWAKSKADLDSLIPEKGKWRETKPGLQEFLEHFNALMQHHVGDLVSVHQGMKKFVKGVKKGMPFYTLRQYIHVEERSWELGPYKEEDPSWPGGDGPDFQLFHPETNDPIPTPEKGWIFSTIEAAHQAIDDNLFVWKKNRNGGWGIPKIKKFLLEGREEDVFTSVQSKDARGAVMLCKAIFGKNKELFGKEGSFPNPKDHDLLARLFRLVTWGRKDALIIDPYAGSGTTAHAVLQANAEDGGKRQFILIEAGFVSDKSEIEATEYTHKITAERIRRIVTGQYAIGQRDGIPGGFTFMQADRKSITKKDILNADRERLSDIILQVAEEESNRVDCRMDGMQYVIGKTRSGMGIALIWEAGATGRTLMADKVRAVHAEAEAAGLRRPYHIYATANDAPHSDTIYQFYQIPDAILARLGIEEDDERDYGDD